ncbi:contactin-associated protein-like 2b isoform X2 [Syngnathoides biaculeatus]|uniref:contactin-associated protein-like 2b isoform X2 n=1 Tax=Syngnathoides biaculeatus TaxID=300417 RepID=UPI002ADD7456|nr:contactin-associated protein-like 2b isoform X2 [Syngnathoides biaculeatus]
MSQVTTLLLPVLCSSFLVIITCRTSSSVNRKCEDSLATPLPYSSFTSSSVYGRNYGAGYAKLNWKQGAGGWSPSDSDHYQWLQVDLGGKKQVVGIATQGRYSSLDWTSKYQLLYSDTQTNWRPYLQEGSIWTFDGNVNSDGVVRYELQHAFLARFIRFVPLEKSKVGRVGVRLELYGCSYWADVIGFDGHGILSYRFRSKKMKIVKDVIALKFRTTAGHGVLLYGEGQQGDYVSLELQRATLKLSMNLGSNQYGSIQGHTSVTSGSLLDDDHWHSVVIERYRRNVNFTLDHHVYHFRTNGEFAHLDLDYEISFGGQPPSAKSSSGGRENFVGCMEGITYNGDNITHLVRRGKVDISSFRNLTFSCAESNTLPVFFNSTSFLRLPGQTDSDTLSVSLSFRTWNPNGLLMFTVVADGWVEMGLTEGKITVSINVTQKKNTHIDISSGSGLNDGQWHSVHLNALENYAMLTVDGDEASTIRTAIPVQIMTGGTYYFGGYFPHTTTHTFQRPFQGCMQLIHIDDHRADLKAVEQGLIGIFENVSLDMCAIIDRCVPNHCEHGSRCSQTWDTFTCNCRGTGYTGATCHTSMFQQSCEDYKHQGQSSGSYWIDPDGSGSIEPFRVLCDMTDKVWTTIRNNLAPQTSVMTADPDEKAVLQITYNVTDKQLFAVTNSAEKCEQFLSYACRLSRLLNTPGSEPFTWWLGRTNEKHFYWGGSGPGIQKCACGIEQNCTNPKHFCNCDADQRSWKEDAGLLVYKDHLPVRQVVVGDTGRAGSEAKLTVGPLKCQGDRKYWNAASFTSPGSSLHFSSFRGEMSTDISFYFKTSSSHGVFLENLGTSDFLHIELRGGSMVSFSFDVGCERMELVVQSSVPLNDDQWHRVEAEKNIKEAVLKLNGEPRELKLKPPQGHTKLEFYSDLYLGASKGQRGFLGCMRALKINGFTFDLKEKAKVTPGVTPGCQGHCSIYGMHCKNGGKCVEQYNRYSCDCSLTAFDGPFCTEDVGAYFETGTLVRYDFLPEAVPSMVQEGKSFSDVAVPVEANLTQEELIFSFSTSSAPSILVYISSRTQDYLAVVLRHNGTLQIRYRLGGLTEPFTIDIDHRNMANGQPHVVNLTRRFREIQLQMDHYPVSTYIMPEASDTEFNLIKSLFLGKVFETGEIDPILINRYNSPGFVGCLSRVQLNSVAPLKAALRSGQAAPVTTHGILVPSNCGASPLTISPLAANDPWHVESVGAFFPFSEESSSSNGINRNSAVLGGIISMVVITVLCIMVFVIRHMFRHKGSYHTNEAKGAESADCADAAIIVNDPAFNETIDESKKEWFI